MQLSNQTSFPVFKQPRAWTPNSTQPCSLPGDFPSVARGGARAARSRGPKGSSVHPRLSSSGGKLNSRQRQKYSRDCNSLLVPSEERQSSACAHWPAEGAPPRPVPPCTPPPAPLRGPGRAQPARGLRGLPARSLPRPAAGRRHPTMGRAPRLQ